MLLDANRPWRHKALVPLRLTEAKKVIYVANVTPKRVTVYLPDPKNPGQPKKVAIAHKSVKKYAPKVVDPPPGENPIGYIEDPDKYTGPSMIKDIEAPKTSMKAQPAKKSAKFVPVYHWDEDQVWVWLKPRGGGQPILTELPHKKVQKYAKYLGWVGAKVELVGKIDPKTYKGPEQILPLDWEPGEKAQVPTADQAVQTVFIPEFDKEEGVPDLNLTVDPGISSLEAAAEFEDTGKKDEFDRPILKHKGSGQVYSKLPDGDIAIYDEDLGYYFRIKKTSDGWEINHDAAPVAAAGVDEVPKSGSPEVQGMGIEPAGEDPHGFQAYAIVNEKMFKVVPDAIDTGNIVWFPWDEWAYLSDGTYFELDWDGNEWWEGIEEYSVSEAILKAEQDKKKQKAGQTYPDGFELPGENYVVKTVTKDYVTVETPEGVMIKWDAEQGVWFYMDEPWKQWSESDQPWMTDADGPPEEKKPKPPAANLPEPPEGFQLAGTTPNKHGSWSLKTSEYTDYGDWFLLPDGSLARYSAYSGEYTRYKWGDFGWEPDTAIGSIPVSAVKTMKYYPGGLPLPDGYSFKGEWDINGLPLVWKGPGTPTFTLLPNGNLAKWSASKNLYKTQLGTKVPLSDVQAGDFGASEKVEFEVSDTPEDAPFNTQYSGKVDVNGYPMVDEFDPDDPDASHVITDMTLLPDDRVAKWSPATKAYRVYNYNSLEGYEKSKYYEEVSLGEAERLLSTFKLTIKNAKYFKITSKAQEKAEESDAPPGFELKTPLAAEQGLVPALHIDTETIYYLLPGDLAAGMGMLPGKSEVLYSLWKINSDGSLTHGAVQGYFTLDQVRALTQGYDPTPPNHTEFASKVDANGFPTVKDEDGELLTVLPNGEVAKWEEDSDKYEVWVYDSWASSYIPRHPEKAYTLKQVLKLKKKKLKALKSTPEPKAAPEPEVAPPKLDDIKALPKPTGKKDLNGKEVYTYSGFSMSSIPAGSGWGIWSPKAGAYAVKVYDAQHDVFHTQMVGKELVYWYPGDPDVHVGPKSKTPTSAYWEWEPTTIKDSSGKLYVHLKKEGKIHDSYVQLPSPLLGKWSDNYHGYLVYVIDTKAKGKTMPVYNTGEVWKVTHEHDGLQYPFEVKIMNLPKEWKGTPGVSATGVAGWVKSIKKPGNTIAAGTWNGKTAYLWPAGAIVLQGGDPSGVWDTEDGYLEEPEKVAPKSEPQPKPDQVAKDTKAALTPSHSGKLPKVSDLTLVGSGSKLGLKGAGKKYVFKDPATGKQFIFKPAIPKSGSIVEPIRAHAQEAFSSLAMKLRPDHIPVTTYKYKGQLGTLQPMLDVKGDLSSTSPENLTKEQSDHVVVEHLLDWVMSQHDSHGGNMIFTADGGVLSIDKEQGFKYFGDDKLDTGYHPNGKYGESEPFYNKFWKAFAKGSVGFDHQALKSAFDKLDHVPTKDFVDSLRPYAKSAFPGDEVKQRKFLKKVLARKLQARAQFEKFIQGLYEEREGKKGSFTVEDGWVGEGESGPKTKIVDVPATEYAASIGIKVRDYSFTDPNTNQAVTDPNKITLKVTKETSKDTLDKFLKKIGVTPIPFPNGEIYIEGSVNFLVAVDRKLFESATLPKEVLIDKQPTPPKPRYFYGIEEQPEAKPNIEVLKQSTKDVQSGSHGQRVTFDGGKVEGQTGKIRREKDAKGLYILKTFKVRKGTWDQLRKGGVETTFKWTKGKYDPDQDAYVYTGSSIGSSGSFTAKMHETPWGEVYVAAKEFPYTYAGAVYMKIRKEGDIATLAKKMLNAVKNGIGDELFKAPTEEELKRRRLFQLLWSLDPQIADQLKPEKVSTKELEGYVDKAVKKSPHSEEDIARVEGVEVYPGYNTDVLPGRWRKLGGGQLWFGIQSMSLKAVAPVGQNGCQSIHERSWFGVPQAGASYSADQYSGAGDHAMCRMVTKAFAQKTLYSAGNGYGEYIAILHPEVFDRLDSYMYLGDKWGTAHPKVGSASSKVSSSAFATRTSVESVSNGLGSHASTNEIMFRRGVGADKVLRIACGSEKLRDAAITDARERGVTELRGVPIEDFVVVCSSCKEAYVKYVEPLVVP